MVIGPHYTVYYYKKDSYYISLGVNPSHPSMSIEKSKKSRRPQADLKLQNTKNYKFTIPTITQRDSRQRSKDEMTITI